jgi:pimeloyl-ACP methyl ester carboxylesterase
MMKRLSTRDWILLMIALGLVVTVSAAGLVLSLNRGSTGQPAAAPGPGSAAAAPSGPRPGTAQAQADLTRMQALLSSGSASEQAAILAPPVQFVPGSGPVFPAGTKVTIRPGTLHASGQSGTVQAVLSDKTAVTLDLYSVQGHWRLYAVQAGAQTSAKVTAGPAAINAQLMSNVIPAGYVPEDAPAPNYVPTWQEIGQKTPVIYVHGFGESASTWSDGGNMLANVDQINGVMSLRFDYSATDHDWVDNKANGPALATYIKAVAQASRDGHGTGKVVLVGFSMGGLLIRYAATTGAEAGDIGMVITIGTPNEGSFAGNIRPLICAGPTVVTVLAEQHVPDLCSDWGAADAMSVFAPQIEKLPQLPPSIPVLHAMAGDETFIWEIWAGHPQSRVMIPFFGDGVVTPGSALHKRPGWQHDTFDTFTNPWIPGDLSVWHLALKGNQQVIAKTKGYIQAYVRAYQPQAPAQAPAQAAPALGGLAYWLAGGGTWYVHDERLQISQGPSGLVGTMTWNAGGAIITGHAQLAFVSQADGSLAGTFTTSATYTYSQQPLPAGFSTPSPADGPTQGQVYTLVPVAPMLAKVVGGYYGGSNWCQLGLPNPTQYCGA